MNKLSPFTQWWEANIQSKMAVSDEIKTLMARAFEGGQKTRELTDEEIVDASCLNDKDIMVYIATSPQAKEKIIQRGRAVLKKASEK